MFLSELIYVFNCIYTYTLDCFGIKFQGVISVSKLTENRSVQLDSSSISEVIRFRLRLRLHIQLFCYQFPGWAGISERIAEV